LAGDEKEEKYQAAMGRIEVRRLSAGAVTDEMRRQLRAGPGRRTHLR